MILLEKLAIELMKLGVLKFWGEVKLIYKNGEIVRIEKTESIEDIG
jgi:hypothetical protein